MDQIEANGLRNLALCHRLEQLGAARRVLDQRADTLPGFVPGLYIR